MTIGNLFSLWPSMIARSIRRAYITLLISNDERNLMLSKRTVADELETQRYLAHRIMNRKCERNSL